jgi:hypothetical protein
MAFPILYQFLKNPSYLDSKQLGYFWKQKYNFDDRWAAFKKQYNTLKVEYYIEQDNYSYYVKLQVPSNARGNTYDVVIHFFTDSNIAVTDHSLRNYNIQIFSNNPVFAFHFGYANYKAGIIIPFLADKLSNEILDTPARKNNPRNAIGYDHSFYIAGMWLMDSARLLNKSYIKEHSKSFNPKELAGEVRSLVEILDEYQANKDKEANKKSFNKDKSILKRAGEFIDDATSKVGELVDNTFKRTSTTHVIKAQKSVGGGKSGITRKSATRSIGTKPAIRSAKRVKPKPKK